MSRLLAALLLGSSPLLAADPSFDCNKASASVEVLICGDDELAELDRELAEIWQRALPAFPEAERPHRQAYQRGWIKGRNDCWKSVDVAGCVRSEYERRITELQILAGLVMAPDAVQWSCEGDRLLWTAYYTNTKLPAAVLTSADEQVLAFGAETATGRLYKGANARFLDEGDRARVEWMNDETTCSKVPSRKAEASPCQGLPTDAGFVVVTTPSAGATVGSSFEVAGCSRTFEGTVTWRLLARNGAIVAEGHTSGGGSGGAEPFRFTVETAGAAGLHHLEVDEPRVTDEGFPPGRTVLPLVLVQR